MGADETGVDTKAESPPTNHRKRLANVEWSKRWGWNMFVVPMGSGAVTKCIVSVPYPWRGQETCGECVPQACTSSDAIATVFLFINIVTFIVCVGMTIIRAFRHWPVFKHSFFDQTEGPWIATVNLSMATILLGFFTLGIPHTGVS